MNLARAFILSLWTSVVVLASLFASSIAAAFLVLESGASPGVPWLFAAIAVGASGVAAFLARLFPAVRCRYPWLKLSLAGVLGWPIAWWTGLETKRALEGATTEGVFAISANLEHTSLWNAAIVLVALLVLLVPASASGAAGPSKSEA